MSQSSDAVGIWESVLEHLKNQMSLATFRSVFGGSQAGFYDGEVLEVALSSKNAVAWAEGRLRGVVERTVGDVLRRPVGVRFSVRAGVNGTGATGTGPQEEGRMPCAPTGDLDVSDRRRVRWYRVDNVVLDDYLPLMGVKAFAVYSLYCRMSGRDGLSWPGYSYICRMLGVGRGTVSKCNAVLEVLGLIEIERGNTQRSNRYYLLEPEVLTETVLGTMLTRAEAAGIAALIVGLEVVLNGNYPGSGSEPPQFSTGTTLVPSENYPSSERELEQDISNKTQEQNTGTSDPPPETVETVFESDLAVSTWLEELGVAKAVAAKLVVTLPRRRIVAWGEYACGQVSLKDPAAFIVKRLRGDRWPPGYDR